MKKNNHNKCVQNETTERVAIIPIPIGSPFLVQKVGLYFIPIYWKDFGCFGFDALELT